MNKEHDLQITSVSYYGKKRYSLNGFIGRMPKAGQDKPEWQFEDIEDEDRKKQ